MLDNGNDAGFTAGPGKTGRTLVLLEEGTAGQAAEVLLDAAGISAVRSGDVGGESIALESLDADGMVFDELDVAVVAAAPDQLQALGTAVTGENSILAVEAERIVYALETPLGTATAPGPAVSAEYLRGFRDAAVALSSAPAIGAQQGNGTMQTAAAPAVDESRATWGLQGLGVLASAFSGSGVNVAVLDTGMAVQHPDFAGRNPVTRSFVTGETVDDGHGHGTHCIGTACGPRVPGQPPRYGIAFDAQIHAGKVLSNRGSGSDEGILGGIDWAITSGCRVVSMSLGAQVPFGTPFSRVFEAVGLRALQRGTLIVAAAGNNRPTGPVNHPANCPSILAVGAIDSAGQIAPFSCKSDPNGGKVDIVAPGVAVLSTWTMPTRYKTISGTSMATPHVAGAAALISEAHGSTGLELWGRLVQSARALPLSCMDVGSGLVQAP